MAKPMLLNKNGNFGVSDNYKLPAEISNYHSPFQPAFENSEFIKYLQSINEIDITNINNNNFTTRDNKQCEIINILMKKFMEKPFGVENDTDLNGILNYLITNYDGDKYSFVRGTNLADMIKDMGGKNSGHAIHACPHPTGSTSWNNDDHEDDKYSASAAKKLKDNISSLFKKLVELKIMYIEKWTRSKAERSSTKQNELKLKADFYIHDCGTDFKKKDSKHPVLTTTKGEQPKHIINWPVKTDSTSSSGKDPINSSFNKNYGTRYSYKLNLFLGWIGCVLNLPTANVYNTNASNDDDLKSLCDDQIGYFISDTHDDPLDAYGQPKPGNIYDFYSLAVGNSLKSTVKASLIAKGGGGDGTVATGLVTESYMIPTNKIVAALTCDSILALKWIILIYIFNIKNAATTYYTQDAKDSQIYVLPSANGIDYSKLVSKEIAELNKTYNKQINLINQLTSGSIYNMGRGGNLVEYTVDEATNLVLRQGVQNLTELMDEYNELYRQEKNTKHKGNKDERKKSINESLKTFYVTLTNYKLKVIFQNRQINGTRTYETMPSYNHFCIAQLKGKTRIGFFSSNFDKRNFKKIIDNPDSPMSKRQKTDAEPDEAVEMGGVAKVEEEPAIVPDAEPAIDPDAEPAIDPDAEPDEAEEMDEAVEIGEISVGMGEADEIGKDANVEAATEAATEDGVEDAADIDIQTLGWTLKLITESDKTWQDLDEEALDENPDDPDIDTESEPNEHDIKLTDFVKNQREDMKGHSGGARVPMDLEDVELDNQGVDDDKFDILQKNLQLELYELFFNYIKIKFNPPQLIEAYDYAIREELIINDPDKVHDDYPSLFEHCCYYYHIEADYTQENNKKIVDTILDNFYSTVDFSEVAAASEVVAESEVAAAHKIPPDKTLPDKTLPDKTLLPMDLDKSKSMPRFDKSQFIGTKRRLTQLGYGGATKKKSKSKSSKLRKTIKPRIPKKIKRKSIRRRKPIKKRLNSKNRKLKRKIKNKTRKYKKPRKQKRSRKPKHKH